MSGMLFQIAIKSLTTALLVATAARTAEIFGARLGSVVASLPVSVGPTYVFLALERGPDFVAASALNSAAGNAATGLFLYTYGTLADRTSSLRGLAMAIAVWMLASFPMQYVTWSVVSVVTLNIIVYGLAVAFAPNQSHGVAQSHRPSQRAWFELIARAAAVATFVCLVVAASAAFGPSATGLAAVFPISLTSLIVILQLRFSGGASAGAAIAALVPMFGYGLMLLVLHLAIEPLGLVAAFCLALAVSLAWSIGVVLARERSRFR